MGGRGLPPERVQAVLGYLAAGLNPNQAAAARYYARPGIIYRPVTGVSPSQVGAA